MRAQAAKLDRLAARIEHPRREPARSRRGRLRRRGRRRVAAGARAGVRRGAGRDAEGAAVPGGCVQPDLLVGVGLQRPHPASSTCRREGQERPRHGARARHPGCTGAGLPVRRHDGRAVPRRVGDRFGVLRHGAAGGHDPQAALGFRGHGRAGLDVVRAGLGRPRRPPRRGRVRDLGAGRSQPRRGLRRAPGRRVDRPARAGRRPTTSATGRRSPRGSTRTSPPTSGSA